MKARPLFMSVAVLLLSPTFVLAQILRDPLPVPIPAPTRGLPDLVVADLRVNADCRVVVTLRNNGPGMVPDAGFSTSPPGSSGVQMYSDGAAWGGIVLGAFDPPKLTQPAGGTASYTWFSSLTLPPGNHAVKVDVDNNNSIAENNEANNSLTKTLACQKPDLAPVDLTLDADCRIVVTIRNNGPAIVPDAGYSTSPPGSSGVQMYKDGVAWGGIVLGALDTSKLTQPAGGIVTYTWFPSLALPPGNHTVKVDVDNNNSVAESNELNNSLTKTLTCQPPLPDLAPTNISAVATGIAISSPCIIVVTVQNLGTAMVPEENFCYGCSTQPSVQMYNAGAAWGGFGLRAFDSDKVTQPPGGTFTRKWYAGPEHQLAPGLWHEVRLDIDDNNKVVESNEANNSLTQKVWCGSSVIAPPTTTKLP